MSRDESVTLMATDAPSVTQDVKDYSFVTSDGRDSYEVHLIDSPGFDDGVANDAEILSQIACYINTLYKMNNTIAGILYLHDITKARMGGVGLRNLRMLENMIGMDKWDNCTLVTTKWGCTDNPAAEEGRELQLKTRPQYFQTMVESAHSASMRRFTKTKRSGLAIIQPHLRRKFTPKISEQMVKKGGPMLSLGQTDAGKVVADGLEKLAEANQRADHLEFAKKILEQKFDEKLFQEYKQKRDSLLSKHRMQRAGRWAMRTVIIGGSIAATVVTLGPGASAFALEPIFERYANKQKQIERKEKEELKAGYKQESTNSETMSKYSTDWLSDRRVQNRRDLDWDEFSLASESKTSLDSPAGSATMKKSDRVQTAAYVDSDEESDDPEPIKNLKI